MVIVSKRNVQFRSGTERFLLKKDEFITDIPDWVAEHSYFRALERDGLIVISNSTSDAAVEAALETAEATEKAVKKARAKK